MRGNAAEVLPVINRISHALPMFIVSEAEAAAIRAIFHESGELSALVELRRLFAALRTMRRRESACGQSPAARRCLGRHAYGGRTDRKGLAGEGLAPLEAVPLMLVSVEEMRSDVVWAMQTRYQGDVDTMFLQGITGHPLDPSQTPECPRLSSKGTTCKTLFDCTVPFRLKEHFVRPQFKELDANLWEPSLFGKAAA